MKNNDYLVTKKLLLKCDNDLKAAKKLFTFEDYAVDIIYFHCQQAVEKALKAFLDSKDIKFEKTHDIEKLLDQCIEIEKSFQQIDYITEMTPYAVEFRYDEIIEESKDEVNETIIRTEQAITFIKAEIVGIN